MAESIELENFDKLLKELQSEVENTNRIISKNLIDNKDTPFLYKRNTLNCVNYVALALSLASLVLTIVTLSTVKSFKRRIKKRKKIDNTCKKLESFFPKTNQVTQLSDDTRNEISGILEVLKPLCTNQLRKKIDDIKTTNINDPVSVLKMQIDYLIIDLEDVK